MIIFYLFLVFSVGLRLGFLIYKWKVLNEYEKQGYEGEMIGKPFYYF